MFSPDNKDNRRLSSNTVFKFSIQSGVIGPSNTMNYRSLTELEELFLKISARTPSCKSYDIGS